MRQLGCTLAAAALSLLATKAQAEEPIRIVYPFTTGTPADTVARLIAQELRASIGRAVIVQDRPGAGGRIGVAAVKSAPPDGNTLLLAPIAPMSIYQHVYPSLGYDPIKDFEPVSQIATFDLSIAVGPQVPAKSLGELVAWIRGHPEQANYATPGAGTLPHLFGVLFGREAGLALTHVPYKGGSTALNELLGGEVPIVLTSTSELVPMHRAGRIKVLATSGAARSPFLPDVPTFQEAGYDIQGTGWHGLFAPRGTPADVLERLSKAVIAAVHAPKVRDRMIEMGLAPTGTSRELLATTQRNDSGRWAPAVRIANLGSEQ